MPALEDHTGLLRTTIPFYNRRNFVNVSNKYQHYTAFPALQRNMRKAIDSKWTKFQFGLPVEVKDMGGTEFKYNLQVTSRNNGQWVSEDDPLNIDKRDFQVQATYPWRLSKLLDYSYGRWEISACKGREEIVNLTTQRRLGNEQGAADFIEKWFWDPPPASTDDKVAFPLRYSLYTEPESSVTSYSNYTGLNTTGNMNRRAFNHNSVSSGPGGVSRVTYPRTGQFNVQWTTFNETDLLDKFTDACLDTDWHSPVDFPNLVKEAPDKACYTTKSNMKTRGKLARQQNDANGSDLLARYFDNDLFRVPWFRVPYFDSGDFSLYSSSNKNVIYGIDWNTWYWASKSGFVMEDFVYAPSREAPHTYTHAVYLGGQLCCLDASRNFVLSQ